MTVVRSNLTTVSPVCLALSSNACRDTIAAKPVSSHYLVITHTSSSSSFPALIKPSPSPVFT